MAAFSIPIRELAERMKADIDTVVRKSTADLFRKVVEKSPVDTGRFRANWNVSYGTVDISTSGSTTQARGFSEAARSASLPSGGVVYLANGLPYARRLEYGYSQQAPTGMARLSALEFSDSVKKAIASK